MDCRELSVAILTNNVHHAARDRQCCLKLHFHDVRVFDDVENALEPLRRQDATVLLIDASIKGMDGCACLRAIRKAARTLVVAAVMVTPDSNLTSVLGAIAAGCNGYVIRPYSLETLERHLRLAWDTLNADDIESQQLASAGELVEQGRFDEAIEEFAEIVEEENQAVTYFNKGMDYLRRQKFGKAILAFNKAVALNTMYAEAYAGMAQAYKGKGDAGSYRACLDKSAAILAMQDRLDELKELFVEILSANPEAVNPYNTMGIDLRKRGDYAGALHAYTQALHLTPNDENLHYNIAKACIFAKDYAAAVGHLEQAVALRDGFEEAGQLLARLRAKQYDQLAVARENGPSAADDGRLARDR
ncbi:MAG: tetratricopeptide repeat protein [Solidesulfovibrio sp.]|uniref:tetratricopeptide repeat protein n=1 Tax=Solidesulfovibrio sp. TaxID=2910990 RepID=UPI002B21395C|nr:tetratricopeptide repeat protein [Solidesulfovibrio sp.]MEA4856923.1 tetratricopeptide repeat protein [Solidesulfovibrio sp.]